MENVLHLSSAADVGAAAADTEDCVDPQMLEEPPMSKPTPAPRSTHEEPEITQEESVPSDGLDTEGQRLMKDVGNSKLHDKGEAEHKTPEKAGRQPHTDPEKRDGKPDPA
jgi:hypothetical protein